MAELALACNIVEILKLTYSIAQFIYKTVESARNTYVEQRDIASDIRLELLSLQTFARYFARAHGAIAKDLQLDKLWLEEIQYVVGRLKQDLDEYASRASKRDPDTLKYAPWLHPEIAENETIEVSIDKLVEPVAKTTQPSFLLKIWKDNQSKVSDISAASRWALIDRKPLAQTVARFRKRNKKLKEILQQATAVQLQQGQQGLSLEALKTDEDAKLLGLVAQAEITQSLLQPDSIKDDYSLQTSILDPSVELSTIHLGSATTRINKRNTITENILIEYKDYPSASEGLEDSTYQIDSRVRSRVNQLAKLLSSSGSSSLNTLRLKGFVDQSQHNRYAFLFYPPIGVKENNPLSLHSIIESQSAINLWSLSTRFRIAQEIAKSIGAFHQLGWIHKGLCSQVLVFFKDAKQESLQFNTPYLTDFEYSRPDSGSTLGLSPNMNEERSLYRHPHMQDIAGTYCTKIHDLYSLGVILLEIGVWQTARSLCNQAKLGSKTAATEIRKLYIGKAKSRLPHRMGESYLNVVLDCLESQFQNQIFQPDFTKIFHDEVIQKLSPKCLL